MIPPLLSAPQAAAQQEFFRAGASRPAPDNDVEVIPDAVLFSEIALDRIRS